MLKFNIPTCRFIKDNAEHIPVQVAELHDAAKKGIHALQKHAQETAARLKVGYVRGKMLRDVSLKDAIGLFGEKEVEKFAERILESAKEGWEGVGKITLL